MDAGSTPREGLDRIDPERAWLAAVLTAVAGLVAGSILFPRTVYDGFIWRYFWGPMVADGTGSRCAQRVDGETHLLESASDCLAATGIIAEPGYTPISTATYALVLLVGVVGVVFLLRRLAVGGDRGFFYALVPFMLFGGALRVVEDANVAFMRVGDPVMPFPWSGLLISPLVYATVFAVTLAALLGSVVLADRELIEGYERGLAAAGAIALAAVVAALGWLAATTDVLSFHPVVPAVTLGGATGIALLVWGLTQRYAPAINRGTGPIGAVVVWGHAVDGIANVLMLDWAGTIGLPGGYVPKHVVNAAIVRLTAGLQPAWLSELVGTAWPFLLVKVGVAVGVVWLFDDELFEESPRSTIVLLVAIVAVGLGPGTRDFLRATFGI